MGMYSFTNFAEHLESWDQNYPYAIKRTTRGKKFGQNKSPPIVLFFRLPKISLFSNGYFLLLDELLLLILPFLSSASSYQHQMSCVFPSLLTMFPTPRPAAEANTIRATPIMTNHTESDSTIAQNSTQQEPSSNTFFPTDEITLLRHFVDFAVPPILVGVEPRWNSSRDALLRLSKSSLPLRHAICAFSALSLGESSPSSMHLATAQSSTYYSNLAMSELRKLLDEHEALRQHQDGRRQLMSDNSPGNDEDLLAKVADKSSSEESILATIFFLSYIEIIVSNAPKSSLDLLNRAHVLMSNREPPRTVLYQQLQIWLKLLDAKVVSAGGEGVHLHANSETRDLEAARESYDSSTANEEANGSNPDDSVLETEEIIFNALNRRAFSFYLQVLNFSGRIARLDKWHRPRGSVPDELEVMLAADKISRDLNALWTRRPAIIDLTDKSDQLRQYLSPGLAAKVEQHLRTYTANFHACFIHLQRVAYAHLRATPR
jgi:hypothetical protein